MKRAIACTRVSTKKQAKDGVSLELQAKKIKEFCDLRDYELEDIYIDRGKSARTLNRPAIKEIMERITKGPKIDVVVFYSTDRANRNSFDALYLKRLLEEKEVALAFASELIDTNTASGKAWFTIKAAINQFQSDLDSEKTKESFKHKRKKREKYSKYPRYGEDYQKGKIVEVREEKQVIRHIFELYNQGESYQGIADKLNENNIPTKTGNAIWYPKTVSNIIKRETMRD